MFLERQFVTNPLKVTGVDISPHMKPDETPENLWLQVRSQHTLCCVQSTCPETVLLRTAPSEGQPGWKQMPIDI